MGDAVFYYNESRTKLIQGTFITSNYHIQSQNEGQAKLDSKFLIVQLLQTEVAVEIFCKQHSISYTSKLR